MDAALTEARNLVRSDPKFAGLEVRELEGRLYLARGDDHFARLFPAETAGMWRMEYFHNLERWQFVDFQGTLRECLEFLSENEHYQFWEG